MTPADKIAAGQSVRRFKAVFDGDWYGMCVRPDGKYVSHQDYVSLADLAEVQARRIAELEAALRLHKAWADSEDAGPDYGGQTRDTHPDGERIWRNWWNGNLDLCARAQEATDAALGAAQ